jgi:hypothetical protein|nr:MAG TPA: hypothetical protein [Crassvirales sp.]
MNTTPTGMVYDRTIRQQQLSIAVASAQIYTRRKAERRRKSPAPTPRLPIRAVITTAILGVVVLITRIAVRREGVLSPEERRGRTTPLIWSWAIPLAELHCGLGVLDACTLASVLHW